MVCWGAQSYCHVKRIGEQKVEAAQCWQNTWRENGSVNVHQDGALLSLWKEGGDWGNNRNWLRTTPRPNEWQKLRE